MELGGEAVRGGDGDEAATVEAFLPKRGHGIVVGVMTCAAAIALSGAVAVATRDEPMKRTLVGQEAPQRTDVTIAIGPIEWSPNAATAKRTIKRTAPTVIPASVRQRR